MPSAPAPAPLLLDGTRAAAELRAELKAAVAALVAQGHRPPHLVALLVGADPASETYVANKIKACAEVGYRSKLERHEANLTEEALLARIAALNADEEVDGFIVQLPLPRHISETRVIEATLPEKDVDGFHPINLGRMAKGLPALIPATPAGVMELLRRYEIPTEGRHAVVIGRSNIVGSPMSILLARNANPGNCTVTLAHSRTPDLAAHTRMADIIVVAAGRKAMLTADMVRPGAVVIDVGMHREEAPGTARGWRLRGDVDYDAVAPLCAAITPVPGGVGPMTIAMLLANTLEAYRRRGYQ